MGIKRSSLHFRENKGLMPRGGGSFPNLNLQIFSEQPLGLLCRKFVSASQLPWQQNFTQRARERCTGLRASGIPVMAHSQVGNATQLCKQRQLTSYWHLCPKSCAVGFFAAGRLSPCFVREAATHEAALKIRLQRVFARVNGQLPKGPPELCRKVLQLMLL